MVPVALVVERVISGDILGKPLRRPFGLAVDVRGHVYVSDAGNSRIIKFNTDMDVARSYMYYFAYFSNK